MFQMSHCKLPPFANTWKMWHCRVSLRTVIIQNTADYLGVMDQYVHGCSFNSYRGQNAEMC